MNLEEIKELKQLSFEVMREYCEEKGGKDLDWFIDTYEEISNKAETGQKCFFTLRAEFAKKYLPHLAPKGTGTNKVPMKEQIEEMKKLRDKKTPTTRVKD